MRIWPDRVDIEPGSQPRRPESQPGRSGAAARRRQYDAEECPRGKLARVTFGSVRRLVGALLLCWWRLCGCGVGPRSWVASAAGSCACACSAAASSVGASSVAAARSCAGVSLRGVRRGLGRAPSWGRRKRAVMALATRFAYVGVRRSDGGGDMKRVIALVAVAGVTIPAAAPSAAAREAGRPRSSRRRWASSRAGRSSTSTSARSS